MELADSYLIRSSPWRLIVAGMRGCAACGESNPARARFCLGCGRPLDDEPAAVPELRRSISIIFADLVGSTVLGESLDAEALRYVTGRYFETMRAAVERHEGTVEKFIGDAVVALFGVPRVREDDALRAVRAAADMRASLTALNDELQRDLAVTLQIRIGVNTGEVIVGEHRAGGSPATGDAVNLAARLEQAAGPGEVLLGEQHAPPGPRPGSGRAGPALALKGKAGPVAAWRLLDVARSAGPRSNGPRICLSAATRSCGCFRTPSGGRPANVPVSSSPSWAPRASGRPGWPRSSPRRSLTRLVLMGRCLSYGQGATYWPVREAVLGAAELTGDEPAGAAEAAFAAVLREAPIPLTSSAGCSRSPGSTARGPCRRTCRGRCGCSSNCWLARRPVVLVVDDLHWAESGLLDVLEHVADWSRDCPIMLLGLARPEFYDSRPTWGGGKFNATAMLLSPLDDAATVSLVDKHDLPEVIKRRIVDTSGGNPLFAEQLVAMLADEGHVDLADGVATWTGGPVEDVRWAMPPSVSALLAARIDRLHDDERAMVGCAAVIGTVFYAEAIAALTGTPLPEVQQALGRLVRKELLRTATTDLPGLSAYRFLHVLVRDAAYAGLAKATRAVWHEQLADWLSSLGGDAVPDEIVGHHLASAWEYRAQLGPSAGQVRELAARAARKLAAAGRRLELSDVTAAAALLQRAAGLLDPDDPYRVECLLNLAAQRIELGEIAHAQEALRLPAEAGNPRQAVLAEVLMCLHSLTTSGLVEDKERVVRAAIARFQEGADDRSLAQAYLVQADLAVVCENWSRSTKLLELALKHGEAAGDASSVARARSLLPLTMMFGPAPAEEAIASLDQMVASSGNDPRVRAEAEQVTCLLHAMCGRFSRARAISGAARQHLAEVGHGLFLANLAQSTGHVAELAGDPDTAEHEYAQSCADLQALGESQLSLDRRGPACPAARTAREARPGPGGTGTGPPPRLPGRRGDTIAGAPSRGLARGGSRQSGSRTRSHHRCAQREPENEPPDAVGEAYSPPPKSRRSSATPQRSETTWPPRTVVRGERKRRPGTRGDQPPPEPHS